MCTLSLFWRVFPDAPVAIAANRDEYPQRPWTDPHEWNGIFAGRDEVAGGTWLGVNRSGVVCGITNRWGPLNDPLGQAPRHSLGAADSPRSARLADRTRGSRGMVVLAALAAPSAADAAQALSTRSPTETNAFGLFVADAQSAFRVDCDDTAISVQPLPPGIAVLANWSALEKRPRSDRALQLGAAVPTGSIEAAWPAMKVLVSDHEGADTPGQPICGHGDLYATVSSTLMAVHSDGSIAWRDTRGNPCVSPFVEREVRLR
jgi:hypothetical protein